MIKYNINNYFQRWKYLIYENKNKKYKFMRLYFNINKLFNNWTTNSWSDEKLFNHYNIIY